MRSHGWMALFLAVCLIGLCAVSLADPFLLTEDLTEEIVIPYEEDQPEAGCYVYSCRYPRIDPETPGADMINSFYAYLTEDARDFGVPVMADYLKTNGRLSARTEIDYTVTCNDGDFFSVLVRTREEAGEESSVFYAGHTFSLSLGKAGATLTLPELLTILNATENDTWLQERQTAKADRLIRELVWAQIEENPDDIPFYDDLDEEALAGCFYPEEDYYLDEAGNPVFFLQPGAAAPDSAGLLRFPVSLEEIRDEM